MSIDFPLNNIKCRFFIQTEEPAPKKQCTAIDDETLTDNSSTSSSSLTVSLPPGEHSTLFVTLGPALYFQMVERAIDTCQDVLKKEIEEAEE